MECPTCHHDNPPNALYCMNCGEKLEPIDTGPESPQPEVVPDAERRQLTVMFCDIVDSASLSEKMDPEDLREVIRGYQEICNKVVRRFEGYIAQYLGDGLLVYFGYPRAHEDDAQRATRAGLAIIEAVRWLNPNFREQWNVELSVRIGIHTGLVVTGEVGEGLTREYLAIGETPNIAARLQGEAAPNTVVVSAATYKLIEGFFACRAPEHLVLKGFSQPIGVCQIDHMSTARLRLDPLTEKLAPIVGREQETNLLFERWQRVNESMGQIILLAGDAGVGKSRLVMALEEHVAKNSQTWLTPCQCSAYHQNSTLYPLIDMLERFVLKFKQDNDPAKKLTRLEGFFAQYGFALSEVIPVFCDLLSVPLSKQYRPTRLVPERQKQLIIDTLLGVLKKIASRQPLLLVVEDLQWADPTTLEFLGLLAGQMAKSRIFALFTYRSNFNPSLRSRPYITSLKLDRLTRDKSIDMIRYISGGKVLPAEVIEQILSRTDGVPLFVEELTKMVLESGFLREEAKEYTLKGHILSLKIPVTLKDSLMARLDRLPSAKELVQLCAILGREFTSEMLVAVLPGNTDQIQRGLKELVQSELLYHKGVFPRASYTFKHALIQETAYQSMLKSTRQRYHRQIGDTLIKRFPELAASQPEIIAHHYSEAKLGKVAVSYWQQAGARALERFANVEAISHLNRALDIIAILPETAKRSEKELAVLLAIGPPLISIKGYASPEVEQIYSRAWLLCRQMGEKTPLFRVLLGLWGLYVVRASHKEALGVGNEVNKLAQGEQDTTYKIAAHLVSGGALFGLAQFEPAIEQLEQGTALYDPNEHHYYTSLIAADLGVFCLAWAAHPLWHAGYPDRALSSSRRAVQQAERLAHPYSVALALDYSAIVHQFRREAEAAFQAADAAITVCKEQKFAYYLGWATIIKGWAMAHLGDCNKGRSQIKQGLKMLGDTGAKRSLPYYLSLLAEVYGKSGRIEKGMQTISEAIVEAENIEERWWEAELYRLKGFLILQGPNPDETKAEDCFRQALHVASSQHSNLLELRAATSLFRLKLQQEGLRNDGFQLLAKIYNKITEGFDTPDLKEARSLINGLL